MSNESVLSSISSEGVATITLNRPDKHNAFDDQMIHQLTGILLEVMNNTDTRVIVLEGNGKNFSAGADLAWMKRMANYSEEENLDDAMNLAKLMHTLYHSPKPTIAKVQGKTFGGGVGLIACCHAAIASEDAQFCFSEAKLGIIPAVIAPFILSAIGPRWTQYHFLQALPFTANQAQQMGLCQQIVPAADLDKALENTIQNLLSNGPNALKSIIQLVEDLSPFVAEKDVMVYTARIIAKLRVSPEGQIGLNAFLNKTKPKWTNS